MRLKRLEIQGFKSFARPVCLEFGEGITAIVGPNGSGKSNISDAIRWVLGEQSARSLRGQRMEDVIFAGSDGKRALGMAEVQLTLDNTQEFLPVDYSEVTVTRRVYRSGDSEFFINKQNCRLRDIHDLFTDTGLGREGYAIIGQGQIEAVLSVRSEDRRVLLEETAGIIKYRQRKEEALRKLEETDVDLLRVSDILHELEGQLDSLGEQAEQARIYHQLFAELREEEKAYYGLKWRKIVQRLEECEKKQKTIQNDLQQWTEQSAELEAEKAELEALVQVLETQIEKGQQELFEAVEAYNQGKHTIQLYTDRLANHQTRSNQLALVQREKKKELEALAQKNQALKGELAEASGAIQNQEQKIKKAQAQLEELLAAQKAKQGEIDALKDEFFEFVRKLADQRNSQRSFAERENNLKGQISALEADFKLGAEKIHNLATEIEALSGQEKELQSQLEKVGDQQRLKEKELEKHNEALRKIQAEMGQTAARDTQLTTRLQMLQELEEGYEGYALGVRRIMQHSQMSQLVLGTVAEVIKVPSGLEVAYEVALGSALQNVITADEKDAKRLIHWLQQIKGGRVTFLPLNSVRGTALSPQDQAQLKRPGVLGTGLELLSFSEEFRPVLASLLARVILTEDLDCALDLKNRLRYFARIVTRDGSVVFPTGAMTGGSLNNRTSGLLARKAELETLQKELSKTKEIGQEQKKLEAKLRLNLDKLTKEIENLQARQLEIQLQRQTSQQNFIQLSREKENLAKEQERFLVKQQELQVTLLELTGHYQTAAAEVDKLETEEILRREQITQLEKELGKFGTSLDGANSKLTQEQVRLAELKAALENLRYQIAALEQREKESKKVLQEAEQEQKQLSEEMIEFTNTIRSTEEANKMLKIVEQDLQASLAGKRKERQEGQGQVQHVAKELAQVQKEQVQKERLLYKGEVELEQLEREQMAILAALQERELDLASIQGMEIEKSEASLKRSIADLQNQIKELGLVNPAAAQEYERVQERCKFLQTQLADLNTARDKLQDVINEMDKLCRTKLWDTFKAVQQEFQAIFSQLFGGGRATLELTDPDSILTTGIEIMACPPGKKLQNLLLLSGGERALTAIALLFAIRKVKPTPFCVLDEIDAALDESNLGRFTRLMEEFAVDTQFLVITHRPKTMEAANTLYGVTMGDEAISQIISVALE